MKFLLLKIMFMKLLQTSGHKDILLYLLLGTILGSVQLSPSVVSDSLWPHELQQYQASLSIANSQSLLKLTSIESVMPSNHLTLFRPLLLLPSINPSIRVFSNESALQIRWPKYWSFSFNINPSNEHLGLISFRMDWLDLLAVQGTLKSLLQHHSSKASILQHSVLNTFIWTWVWASSGSWWQTGKPGMPQSLGSQSQTWLSNWIELTVV